MSFWPKAYGRMPSRPTRPMRSRSPCSRQCRWSIASVDLDILVNNAGVFANGQVDVAPTISPSSITSLPSMSAALPPQCERRRPLMGQGGRIISIGSVAGDTSPWPGVADYSATKGAVAAYTRGWARDLGPKGITVNNVQPGPIDTDMAPKEGEVADGLKARTALGRYGKPEEVAAAVSFLASPAAAYITGATPQCRRWLQRLVSVVSSGGLAMIERRPFAALGGADHGWLKAKHHFSFARYYDPERLGHGALRVWNDDEIAPNTGFPPHPHADMEIITYVRQGAITHEDSLGHKGRTEAGDVQVMSAGSGIRHAEYNREARADHALPDLDRAGQGEAASRRGAPSPFPRRTGRATSCRSPAGLPAMPRRYRSAPRRACSAPR